MMRYILLACAALLAAACTPTSVRTHLLEARAPTTTPREANLRILNWNMGYAGLGAGSDFQVDGGKHTRVPSRAIADANAAAIAAFLSARTDDVLMLQEMARPSYPNRGVDLLTIVDAATPAYHRAYAADFRVPIVTINVGQATYMRGAMAHAEAPTLHNASLFYRAYPALVTRGNYGGREYAFVNVHLAAFDDGDGRTIQLRETFEIAAREHAEGRLVIIAGDYNLELAPAIWPHTTKPKDLAWVHPFNPNDLPAGWTMVADGRAPTVRSLDKPYVERENWRGVIDGFFLSPGLCTVRVETIDLRFQHSDHNPVALEVRPC